MRAFHPYADFLPAMNSAEYAGLREDMRTNGLHEPIVRNSADGAIVDGRHRVRACDEIGIEPTFRDMDFTSDEEILSFVLSQNLHRRHLDESQRAMVAAKIATMKEGRPSLTRQICLVSQDEAASLLNTSSRSVRSAKAIIEKGSEDLIALAEKGDVPVSVAEKIARMEPERQADFVTSIKKENAPPAHQILAKMNRDTKRQEVVADAATMPPLSGLIQRYPILLVDPPWSFPVPMGHTDRSIENHYPTMPLEAICELPVADVATPDATLFLWVTVPMAEAAFCVVKSWGFRYVSQFCWIKPKQGTGYHARNRHELVYICRRGSLPLQEPGDTFESVMMGLPRVDAHSAKPDELMERIEQMYPDMPKIELFSRSARDGWAAWGFEA